MNLHNIEKELTELNSILDDCRMRLSVITDTGNVKKECDNSGGLLGNINVLLDECRYNAFAIQYNVDDLLGRDEAET